MDIFVKRNLILYTKQTRMTIHSGWSLKDNIKINSILFRFTHVFVQKTETFYVWFRVSGLYCASVDVQDIF